jgi:hypothetical protein
MNEVSPYQRMYCRKCFYPLSGLSECCCPECGRQFELSNPRSFLRQPPQALCLSMPSKKILFVLGLVGLSMVIALAIKERIITPQPAKIKLVPFNPFVHPGRLSSSAIQLRYNTRRITCPGRYNGPYARISAELNDRLMKSMPNPSLNTADLQAMLALPPWRVSLTQSERVASQ